MYTYSNTKINIAQFWKFWGKLGCVTFSGKRKRGEMITINDNIK